MVAPRYASSGIRAARRGLSIVECVFAVSVIVGLTFVTFRIMSMGVPAVLSQTIQTETAPEMPPAVPEANNSKEP